MEGWREIEGLDVRDRMMERNRGIGIQNLM
jgi:hypothetical protein